jgi:hypothetical protein
VLLPLSLSVSVFLRDFPNTVSDQQLLTNSGITVILALGVLSAPSLQVETKPEVDLGTPSAMLEEASLVSASSDLLLLPPINTPFCGRQQPESGDFVWLTVFQYHLVGMT